MTTDAQRIQELANGDEASVVIRVTTMTRGDFDECYAGD